MQTFNQLQPSFHILICLIEIWTPEDMNKPMDKTNRSNIKLITECEQLEICESYKQLVGTANVRFPRGTVIKRTITNESYEYNSKVSVDTSDHGIVYETRVDSKKAELSDFKIGDRITIRLGYTEDTRIADLGKTSRDGRTTIFNNDELLAKYKQNLTIMFEGYITKVSLDTPIELQCENLASGLKRITCPKKTYKAATVNSLFSSDDKSDKLLDNTGLILDPKTKECNISLGKLEMTTDLQVSDILLKLNERGLYGFVQFESDEKSGEAKQPILTICRSYFSNPENDSILNAGRRYGKNKQPIEIDFGYNVAENGLSLMDTDKDFMVVEATGTDKDGKTLHVTLRRNPQWEEGQPEDDKWQWLNETTETKKQKKKKAKKKKGAGGGSTARPRKKKWKMSEYTTIKFTSKKVSTTMKELKAEAIKYFEGYNMNGIDGSLTLFGDLKIRCADIVTLSDPRQPHKNGQYLVEEVTTKFGVNGYRQVLKLPYCLSRNTKNPEIDNEQN